MASFTNTVKLVKGATIPSDRIRHIASPAALKLPSRYRAIPTGIVPSKVDGSTELPKLISFHVFLNQFNVYALKASTARSYLS
ncbi:hypothetical protein D3C73_1159260 [compost metagenome]